MLHTGPNFITESSDTPFQDISLSITFNTGILKKGIIAEPI